MSALTSILLTVLAQAAAPTAQACNPSCGPGQVCAPSGQCFMPAQSPPPGYASPPQGYTPAQATGYPPPQSAPPPGTSYAPPPAYQQPGYGYPPPPSAGYPPPPSAGYPPPPSAGYPPPPSAGYPPPPSAGYPPAQLVAPQRAPYREGPRFGLFLGGLVIPGADVSAAAGGAILTFGSQRVGFESRVYGAFAHVEDSYTKTNAGVAVVHGTYWWGVYGLGFGSGLGYADFSRKDSGGWNDSSMMILAYVAPVMLRFGRQPTFEIGLNSGATRFLSHDVRPYGYLYGGLLF